ncbi:Hypothetical protein SRAE_1000205600 [Strongyloides ratti]|uniref:Uncharacterized protein n=1 Tax=Strongyloides ratti TaxID=34506 RepID=A0A090L6R7_STRRB|nr:Hypothetical protein SRAE_1000205600 [Strongyloides ratti]CEF63798.1 Hypothetical protein SRAE_1000205600 [Strongyloides ratti]
MSADGSVPKPKTTSSNKKRSSSKSRLSKTDQRPRSTSKSRKVANTEPRKVRTSKSGTRERSRSRNRSTETTIKTVIQKTTAILNTEKPIIEPTRMVLRNRILPKDDGIETVRPATPLQPVKELPKPRNENKMVKMCQHVKSNKFLYLLTIVFFIALSIAFFYKQNTKVYIDQLRIKITHFLEKQRRKISS